MNTERLLAHYERIADAPDAINRLRRFILDLAIRGKIVEQDPKEESASIQIKRIQKERTKLHPYVKPDKNQHAGDINHNVLKFDIPSEWISVSVREIMHVEMGQSPSSEHYNKEGNGLPFFQGKADFGLRHPSPRNWCTAPKKIAILGDILISVRAPVGPTNIAKEECCIGRGLAALKPYAEVETGFILIFLKAFESAIEAMGYGSTFVAITKSQLTSLPLPFPPHRRTTKDYYKGR